VIAYLRDPQAIYARSFAIIRSEADLSHLPPDAEAIATRVIHACGMPEIAADLRISDGFVTAAASAIVGFPVGFVDRESVG
jgi:precorrin-8X/cobalt-precorrin-8 methylmutase